MTTPDSGATGATGSTGSSGTAGSTPAPTPAAPSGPLTQAQLPPVKVGELVTDVALRTKVDPNTGATKLDTDADGNPVLDGPGDLVGVCVAIAKDGTPSVVWFSTATAYGAPLIPLIDPPTFP